MPKVEVIVGTLGRAHGLFGEIFVDSSTDSPELRFKPGAQVWVNSQALTIAKYRVQGERGVLRLTEVTDRTAAEKLTGARVLAKVDSDEATDEPGAYFDHQLLGMSAQSEDGEHLGTIARIEHGEFQDLLVIDMDGVERLIPFVDDLVPEVDLAARVVTIRQIPGLLEEEE